MHPDSAQDALQVVIVVLHFVAGFIVLAEGLNKLERTPHVCDWPRELHGRVLIVFKVFAWLCLCTGAAGAMARPFVVASAHGVDLHFGHVLVTDRVSLADLLVLGGFALLIVRSRFKELQP